MADRTLSLPGMGADAAAMGRVDRTRRARFDPPRYYTPVHVAGYSVLTSIAATRRRQRRTPSHSSQPGGGEERARNAGGSGTDGCAPAAPDCVDRRGD